MILSLWSKKMTGNHRINFNVNDRLTNQSSMQAISVSLALNYVTEELHNQNSIY